MARQTLTANAGRGSKIGNVALWIVQVALAVQFLMASYGKLSMPLDDLATALGLPAPLVLFVSVAEAFGALGLVLPGLLRIQRRLTPLAATCLVLIMAGAVTTTIPLMGVAPAVLPFVLGVLAACVAIGRSSWWTPISRTNRKTSPHLAHAH